MIDPIEDFPDVVTTFYQFFSFPDFSEYRDPWLKLCQTHHIKGTLLLAPEGINGTLAGSRENIDAVISQLRRDPRLAHLETKESRVCHPPFDRMKVKLKKELVPLGIPEIDPSQGVGQYVSPEEWNDLIDQPDVIVLDTRNDYEAQVGTFVGARDPHIQSFREFPDYVQMHLNPTRHPRVAMFCTGGIRCEKASAYLLAQGFPEVYQLQGGILKYLEVIPTAASRWQGECYVFDQRVAVDHDLGVGTTIQCSACGHPVLPAAQAAPEYQPGLSCPHCFVAGSSRIGYG